MPDLLPLAEQPRPIVLDPALRTPLAAKLVANAAAGRSHRPLICTTATEEAVRASAPNSHRISLPALLGPASPSPPLAPALGRSLMVEGGASILASFLAEPDLVDLVVVTIAPTFVGPEGVDVPWRSSSAATATGAEPPARGLPRLEPLRTEVFGNDTVLFCRPVWS
ncbi:2,5-diamino-6-(ribosylamino)-4(3H)-pyrimidinone 5'-phosphate reductase [Rhodotorula sphaerocarpa]